MATRQEAQEHVIDLILNDKQPNPRSYRNRKSAEPENKRTTLTNVKNARAVNFLQMQFYYLDIFL